MVCTPERKEHLQMRKHRSKGYLSLPPTPPSIPVAPATLQHLCELFLIAPDGCYSYMCRQNCAAWRA